MDTNPSPKPTGYDDSSRIFLTPSRQKPRPPKGQGQQQQKGPGQRPQNNKPKPDISSLLNEPLQQPRQPKVTPPVQMEIEPVVPNAHGPSQKKRKLPPLTPVEPKNQKIEPPVKRQKPQNQPKNSPNNGGTQNPNQKSPNQKAQTQNPPKNSPGNNGQKKPQNKQQTLPAKPEQEPLDGSEATSKIETTDTLFESLPINPNIKRAIKDSPALGYTNLTRVQDASIPFILKGEDVLAKARTGSGKTIAFLLGVIHKIAANRNIGSGIPALVIAPTRELACQISKEAAALTMYLPMKVITIYGGTSMKKNVTQLGGTVHIVVATPGRLLAHLRETPDIPERFKQLEFLILDECDTLLDMGFRPDIEKILAYLPPTRQTLLFSATMPAALHQVKALALKKGHAFVDTVGEDAQETHAHIPQQFMSSSIDMQLKTVDHVLHAHMQTTKNYKIIVFLATARQAEFFCKIFSRSGIPNCLPMHSRMNQSQRIAASNSFLNSQNVILFSSDVSARGMDYPNVTLVVQVGLTDLQQYTHRLGRTGRAGRAGQGLMIAASFEVDWLKRLLKDQPIEEIEASKAPIRAQLLSVIQSVETDPQLCTSAEQTYQAWLGFYNSHLSKLKWDKIMLVKQANHYASVMGLQHIPTLKSSTIGKMGLSGIAGLVRETEAPPAQKQKQAAKKFYKGVQ